MTNPFVCLFGTANRATATATVVIAVVTTVYAIVSYKQWQAMLESNRINNVGLVEIQRASVTFEGFGMFAFTAGFTVADNPKSNVTGPGIAVAPIWTNAGNTGTKQLSI